MISESDFSDFRPTWCEINLSNLTDNFKSVKNFVGENLSYMAVVKADGYGHGAVECARTLEKENVEWFGVALPEEGIELRKAGITRPILCLGGFWHNQANSLFENRLTPVIFDLESAEKLNLTARTRGEKINVHVKVDTGMGRLGVRFDAISQFAERLKPLENLRLEGLMTHFATADNLAENAFTNLQIERFDAAAEIFRENGFSPIYKDLANSPGAIAHPDSRKNLVRLGGVLYGLGGDVLPKEIEKPDLRAVLSLYSQISLLKKVPAGESLGYSRTFVTAKDSIIATVPIGYHDGYPRILSNRAGVIVRDKIVPVVGRISMDWIILDVTDVSDLTVGERVVLIGEQNNLMITAEDLAVQAETISYEITCGINHRVRRKYVDSE